MEEESGESSNQEEDDTDGVESDENDADEVGILNETLERRTTAGIFPLVHIYVLVDSPIVSYRCIDFLKAKENHDIRVSMIIHEDLLAQFRTISEEWDAQT